MEEKVIEREGESKKRSFYEETKNRVVEGIKNIKKGSDTWRLARELAHSADEASSPLEMVYGIIDAGKELKPEEIKTHQEVWDATKKTLSVMETEVGRPLWQFMRSHDLLLSATRMEEMMVNIEDMKKAVEELSQIGK